MARILRGEVVWADLNPTRGHEQSGFRPVVIVSRERFNARSGTVIAMAITSRPQRAGYPFTLELEDAGLPKRSWVKIDQIRNLSTLRLGETIGFVTTSEMNLLIDGLNQLVTE